MNAHTFDGHSVTCPICHRSKGMRLGNTGNGLYMCPYCQERFVVTESGHYVRDPQPNKKLRADGLMLRRQSRPLARMRRDFRIVKPISLIAIVGSAIFLGYTLATLDERPSQQNRFQEFIEWVTKLVE
ncbi:hypothetical protein [Argonema antarcticum]|uniref:hypothetical protein n=1 Tax=Argonema antarcticum TaxID=2942763 RepID=UPI002011B164|nr:hypothetical protein [Argonema antarcticum]MCL1471513.1 hypothetical protein [Argonema antarcticum A004/B2]